MGHKNNFATILNWQATSPITGFLPLNNNTAGKGSVPSGTSAGVMTGTNTIYSNILDCSRMDNIGFEINWTGTPTGTISILASNSGINFYALTFSPGLIQPAGSASGYLVNINQFSYRYIMAKYINASGVGALTIYPQFKDLN
jgi:hypothetical protein